MDMELFEKYGAYALFAYLIIERSFPIIARAMDKIIPSQIKRLRLIEEAKVRKQNALEEETLELEKRKLESEERLIDLREREVLAMEDIAKHLIIFNAKFDKLDSRLDLNERTLTQVSLSLATANQTLAILLDRSVRRREDFETGVSQENTQPIRTIQRRKKI